MNRIAKRINCIAIQMKKIGQRELEMFRVPGIFNSDRKSVLIIANCYGVLLYIQELMEEMYKAWEYNIFSFNLSGQGNSEGKVSLANFTEDLDLIYQFLMREYGISVNRLTTFISCSGLFPLTELVKKRDISKLTGNIIIYNLLYMPGPRFKAAVIKMKKYRVRFENDPIDINYDIVLGLKKIESAKIPIVIFHPQGIPENPQRATKEQLAFLENNFNNVEIYEPEDGFNIKDISQRKIICRVIERDLVNFI